MDLQKAFDRAAEGMLKQKQKCMTTPSGKRTPSGKGKVPVCRYQLFRKAGELRCGVGFLMAPGTPRRIFRFVGGVQALIGAHPDALDPELGEVDKDALSFLSDLQGVHDRNNPRNWKEKLRALARRYKLDFPDKFKDYL